MIPIESRMYLLLRNTIDHIYVNVHVSFLYLIDIGYEHYLIQPSSDSPRATFWLLVVFPCRFIYGSEERHILIQITSSLLNSWTRRRKGQQVSIWSGKNRLIPELSAKDISFLLRINFIWTRKYPSITICWEFSFL